MTTCNFQYFTRTSLAKLVRPYATKFDPVKCVLLRLIPCNKAPEVAIASVEMAESRTSGKRSGQPHK